MQPGKSMTPSKSERNLYERKMTEEDILGVIVQMLELNGARVFRIVERIPWGRKTSTPGIPDLMGWFTGPRAVLTGDDGKPIDEPFSFYSRHFFIEVKRPGGPRRPAQVAWIEQAQRDGVIAFFAEGWPDVVTELGKYGIT